jgi:tRNA-specific 2-thiouridylase
VKKDVEANVLYVSHGYDPETAYRSDFGMHDFHFLTEGISELPSSVTFKIRHTPDYHPAQVEKRPEGGYTVHSAKPIHGVAPGQFCVVYDENHHRCFGSGEITI